MQELLGDDDERGQVRPQVLDGRRLFTGLVGIDAAADIDSLRLVLDAHGRLAHDTRTLIAAAAV